MAFNLTRSVFTQATRGYATAAAAAHVKPPVQLTSLSGTYATSTYLAAAKKSEQELQSVAKDAAALEQKIKSDAKISAALNNPTLSDNDRKKIIEFLLPSSASPILSNLMLVLSDNQRLPMITSVLDDLSILMSAHRGELLVTVTSAEPLAANSGEMKRLEKALKGSNIAKGKELKLINKVNESILGGLMVDFGDKTIDMTAKSRVTKYSAAIQEAV